MTSWRKCCCTDEGYHLDKKRPVHSSGRGIDVRFSPCDRTHLPVLWANECSAGEVLTALRTALTGESTSNVQNYSIVINLRLPRILTAIIVGAGLSCAGNAYQSLFSNPLATPDILGVTSGTCVGAILAIILSCSILETQLMPWSLA